MHAVRRAFLLILLSCLLCHCTAHAAEIVVGGEGGTRSGESGKVFRIPEIYVEPDDGSLSWNVGGMGSGSPIVVSDLIVPSASAVQILADVPTPYAAGLTVSKTGVNSPKGYDFVIDNQKILLKNSIMSASDSKWVYNWNHAKIYRDETLGDGQKYVPGWVTVRFYDCVESADGKEYDLLVKCSNIWFWTKTGDTDTKHAILCDYDNYGCCFESSMDGGLKAGTWMEINYSIVEHGKNTPVSGSVLMGFQDLDIADYDGNYSMDQNKYQEAITLKSGVLSTVYLQSNSVLYVTNNNMSYYSTQGTNSAAEELRSGLSFLADAGGVSFIWSGCGAATGMGIQVGDAFKRYKVTPSSEGPGTIAPGTVVTVTEGSNKSFTMKADDHATIADVKVDGTSITVTDPTEMTYTFSNVAKDHTIHVKFVLDTYTATTRIRYQDVDGNWGGYEVADTQVLTWGEAYSYEWERNKVKDEPEAVYYDASPGSVGTESVTGDVTYDMDVARKQYTYRFDFNLPSGCSLDDVGNRQADLADRYAETVSGAAKAPELTGYEFLGWNTKADGSGTAYASEPMLSDKTFYARWKTDGYEIRYDGNGRSEPDKLPGEQVQNVVTTVSGMPNSSYLYNRKGSLRKNDFVRNGYRFVGWNTEADGSGTSYPDEYDNVYNWSDTDGETLTLYAQWEKQPGTETLTVVSEETGNPVPGVRVKLFRKVDGNWTEVTDAGIRTTDANGQVTVSDLHWFDYEWRCVSVPDGYSDMGDVGYGIRYDKLSQSDEAILYMKHVAVVLHSEVSDIIRGEAAPAFLYTIEGRDAAGVSHTYHVLVQVDGSTKVGQASTKDLFAGNYRVTGQPVSRYLAETCRNILHAVPEGTEARVDVLHYGRAEVLFPYTIRQYGGFGSMDSRVNEIKK